MEIEFCDLCNESVPLSDFSKGRAVRQGARVVCAKCEAAMGGTHKAGLGGAARGAGQGAVMGGGAAFGAGAATVTDRAVRVAEVPIGAALPGSSTAFGGVPADTAAAQEPRRGRSMAGAFGAVTGVLALGGVAALGSILATRIDGIEGEVASAEVEIDRRLDSLPGARARAIAPLTAELTRIESAARAGDNEAQAVALSEVRALEQRIEAAAGREAALLNSIESLRAELSAMRAEAAGAQESLRAKLENVENIAEFHGNRIVQLEERVREAGALVAAGVVPAAGAVEGGADAPKRWAEFLPDLENPDAALRLDAVSHLAETKDADVVPYILPLLDDSDLFVRMVVAQALGVLDARVGVSALIERLEDDSVTVREAAMISLRTITGKSFGFAPDAREVERRRKIDAWRDWWRKAGDDFLTS